MGKLEGITLSKISRRQILHDVTLNVESKKKKKIKAIETESIAQWLPVGWEK